MTTDEKELRGLKMLIEQTRQRALAYAPRISDPMARRQADITTDGLADLSICIDVAINELMKKKST